ncbi:MAG: ABC transporter substrate-binding protein, partial [Vicinamibacterales bacterium]
AGTGPFMLDNWQRGEYIAIKRFEGCWGEEAYLDRVIIKSNDDPNTRLLALRSGEADSIYVPLDHRSDVVGLDGIQVIETLSWTISYVGFNQAFCHGPDDDRFDSCMAKHGDAVPRGADGTADPLFFGNAHMRRAWIYAFDYDAYINDILEGHGQRLNGGLPEGIFGHDPTIPPIEQDLAKAREELALANHPGGFEITIFYNSGNTVREKTASLIKQNVEALLPAGKIKVTVQGLDWSTAFLPKTREGGAAIFYLGWAPDYAFPDNYLVNAFGHSRLGVYAKRVAYESPALDLLLDEALVTINTTRLVELYHRAVRILNEDAAYLWLGQLPDLFVAHDHVKGYYHNPVMTGSVDYQAGDYSRIWISRS